MKLLTFLGAACLASVALAGDVERGVTLYEKGDYNNAVSELRGAVESNGDDARANRYLGLALIEQGKVSDAEQYIRKADQLDPNGETKCALTRLLIEQKKYDDAESTLKEASGDEAQYLRGMLLVNKKQNEEGVRELESYLEKHPDKAYAHYYAGLGYSALRKPDKMMTHFETFLRMKPDSPEARKVRAVMRTGK